MPGGAAVAASEARTVHVRPGRLPSTETGLALCTDRPRAEDPGRSGRSELSGSGRASKRWELNTVLIVNTNNRTTVGLANNTGQR